MLAWTFLFFAVLGYKVLQLTSPETSLRFGSVTLEEVALEMTSARLNWAVMTWVKVGFPRREAFPVLSYNQKIRDGSPTVMFSLVKRPEGWFEVKLDSFRGETFQNESNGVEGGWEHVAFILPKSVDGKYKLTLCLSEWSGTLQCSHILTSNLQEFLQFEDAIMTLGLDSEEYQGELVDAKLILGQLTDTEIKDLMSIETCAQACMSGCWGPGNMACTGHIQLLDAEEPKDLYQRFLWNLGDREYFGHPLFSTPDFAVSGWFYLSPNILGPLFTIQSRECTLGDFLELCLDTCKTLSLCISHNSQVQVCLFTSGPQYEPCVSTHPILRERWYFLTVSYCAIDFPKVEVCSAAWDDDSLICAVIDAENQLLRMGSEGSNFDVLELGGDDMAGGLVMDLRYHYQSCFSANKAYERFLEMKQADGLPCEVLASRKIMWILETTLNHQEGSIIRNLPRKLAPTHYSALVYQPSNIATNEDQYFTFVNNHVSTLSITIAADYTATGMNLLLCIYKPWNGNINTCDWTVLSSAGENMITLTPSDSVIVSKGGDLKGTYTVRVHGNTGGSSYVLQVLISCSSTTSTCFCPAGAFPNTSTAYCSACPAGDVKCPIATVLGCLPVFLSTSATFGSFSCSTCLNSGTTLDMSTGTCASCDSTCLTCAGTSSTDCMSCYSFAGLTGAIGSSNCVCLGGFFPNPTSANCSPCNSTCATCTNATLTGCTGCKANASLSGNHCECFPGYGGTAENCLPCDVTCATCITPANSSSCMSCKSIAVLSGTSPNTCVCPSGSIPSPDSSHCCSVECLTCSGPTSSECISCHSHAYLSASSCVCVNGYYPSPDTSKCIVCDPTCRQCAGAGTSMCTVCQPNASLFISPGPSTCQCDSSFYPNPSTSNCQICDSTCLTCSGGTSADCVTCKNNAALNSGTCVCNDSFYPDITSANCQPCDPTCFNCVGALSTQCTQCFTNAGLRFSVTPGICDCNWGYYPSTSSTNCVLCHPTCSSCTGGASTQCTNCKYRAWFLNVSPNSCVCNNGLFPSTDSSNCTICDPTCLTCNAAGPNSCTSCATLASFSAAAPSSCSCISGTPPCITCHPTCSTCNGVGPGYCTSCYSNAGLETSSNPNSFCNCHSHYFPSPDTNSCQECDSTCLECWGSKSSCYSCYQFAVLFNYQQPSSCVCAPGYYPNPTVKSCALCDSNCSSCSTSGTGHCTVCYPNAHSSSPGTCECNQGFYPSPDASKCLPCFSTCQSCSSGTQVTCNSCYGSAVLLNNISPGSCVCPDGFFPNPTSASCQGCDGTCKTCIGGNPTDCTQCFLNATFENQANPGKCICNTSYYPHSTSANCVSCDSTCYNCNSGTSTGCTACYGNASLLSGPCVCNSHYFPNTNSQNCAICDQTCKECTGSLGTSCSSCYSNAALGSLMQNCLCLTSYFPNPHSNSCTQCDITCNTCAGAGPAQCTSCKTGASLPTGVTTGTCQCNQHYYPNPNASSCVACDTSCSECIGTTTGDCTVCYLNAVLVNGMCPGQCVCPDGYYTTYTVAHCAACDQTCNTCSGPTASDCVTCSSGFYPNPTAANCSACDPTCFTCSSGTSASCSQCQSNAALIGGMNPGTCQCIDGFFPNSSPASCQACHSTCLTCLGGDAIYCLTCKSNAELESNVSEKRCVCSTGFFPNPTSATCAACDKTCLQCVAQSASHCSSCKNFAILAGPIPNVCECSVGGFPAPDSSNCALCDPTCLTCTTTGSSSCASCKALAFLSGPPPNTCQCNPGFFPNPDASNCSPCLASCATCSNSSECTTCKDNAELENTLCTCLPGFYGSPDASNCVTCTTGCVSCLITGCLKCQDTLYSLDGKCLTTCPRGYQGNGSLICEAVDMSPPVPALIVTANNSLLVTFDKPMNCTLMSLDISVEVQDSADLTIQATWSDPIFSGPHNMDIHLVFESTYIPTGSTVNLTFLGPEKVKDEYEVAINITSLSGVLNKQGSPPPNTTAVLLQTAAAQQAAAVSKGTVTSGVTTSLINGNPACLMSLVNQLQIITYLSMTKLPLPSDFASTLAALNVGSMLPNPLSNIIVLNETSQASPVYVQNYGINTTLFILNSLSVLGTACLILLSYVPIYLLSKVNIKFIADHFKRMLPSLMWSTPLQLWLTSYLDIGVFCCLQLLNPKSYFSDVITGSSFIIACAFAACFAMTPVLLIFFIYWNFGLMSSREDSAFNLRWGSLFLGFKKNYGLSSLAYYSLFVIRRFILATSLIFSQDHLTVFVVLNTASGFLVLPIQVFLYLLVFRPYEAKISQMEAVLIEGSTCLVYFTAGSFLLNLSAEVKAGISTFGVWLVKGSIFMNVSISLVRLALNVFTLLKAYQSQMKYIQSKYHIQDIATIPQQTEMAIPSEMKPAEHATNWIFL